jgi:nicotinate-nucleotide pyrophosphorylase (carboxylating)
MKNLSESLKQELKQTVKYAIAEDIGSGDITAALIPKGKRANAQVLVRHEAVLSGSPWFDEVYDSLDRNINIIWHAKDGDAITKNQIVCELIGPAASILTGERTALNFLQTLSATATATYNFSSAMIGSNTKILDTRKTIPGLRLAQKYAVRCGGGHNHRLGLYDAILIKENHIAASGSISNAVQTIRISNQAIKIEVEVESIRELKEALDNNVDMVLLDNFSVPQIKEAVKLVDKKALIELSGGITLNDVAALKSLGVDYISVGALTKDIRATDFSMLFEGLQ